jgi:predicted MFS family arabinose efflux permease
MNRLDEEAPATGRNWYILIVLTAALTLSYIDRFLLAVLVQPIKQDLHLSDTAIGVLTGFAFAAFYAVLGLPLSRYADRGYRRNVILGSVFVWSVMTGLCGAAYSLWQMLLARFGVGIGEAGLVPTAQSLIMDLFPPRRRSTAMGLFLSGGTTGLIIAFILGSRLEALIGWRMTFMAMTIPGILLTLLVALTISEPRTIARAASSVRTHHALRVLWDIPAYRHVPFTQSALVILIYAQTQWLPAFIERSFGVSRMELGKILGLTQGVAAFAGIIAGGVLADLLAKHGELWRIRIIILGVTTGMVPAVLLYFTHSVNSAYLFAALSAFCFSSASAPFMSFVQAMVPVDLRATAAAVALMAAAFLGLGAGPFVVGWISDMLAGTYGVESLRYALLITVSLAFAWALFHLSRLHSLANDPQPVPLPEG